MIEKRLRAVILEQTGIDADTIGHEVEFMQAYNLDSLDFIDLVIHIEQEFDVEIPDSDLSKLTTFSEIVKYIEAAKQ